MVIFHIIPDVHFGDTYQSSTGWPPAHKGSDPHFQEESLTWSVRKIQITISHFSNLNIFICLMYLSVCNMHLCCAIFTGFYFEMIWNNLC